MRHLDAIATLLRVADERSSLLGVTSSKAAETTLGTIGELDEIGTSAQELLNGMGGEGGLKPQQVETVRRGLQGMLARATTMRTQLGGLHEVLRDQAVQLEQFGRGETLMTDAMREELARTPAPPQPAASSPPGASTPLHDVPKTEPAREVPEPAISER